MGNGYWGKVLRVDLSTRKVIDEIIDESIWKKVLGGAGLGAWVLRNEVRPDVKPLDPENRIIFAGGPLQTTTLSGAAKFSITSRSPLTGIYGDSAAGGDWGIQLKKTGYDAIIVQGRSDNPVYLVIDDESVSIRDGSHIWGHDTYETCDMLVSEFAPRKVSIACIGPAGEKKVAIACIAVDKHSYAGRCGLGAVMGAKNLKAIVVSGDKKIGAAKTDELRTLTKAFGVKIRDATKGFTKDGTSGGVVPAEAYGDLPIKYWSGDIWKEGAKKIGAPVYGEVLQAKPVACRYCVIACHRRVNVDEPTCYAMEGAGPEYETLGMMGACCLIDDVKAIAKANDLCNRYGIDTISAGAFAAFSMQCYEEGILSEQDVDMDLHWGNADALIELIHQLGRREGLGELFADGIVPAARQIGEEAEQLAVHVKGLDMPAHDPRAFFSLAVNYATSPRGCCHERGNPQVASQGVLLPEVGINKLVDRFTMENTEFVTAKYQDFSALANSLCFCKFMFFGGATLTDLLGALNAVTGWEWDMKQFMQTGETIFTLQRLVNTKYGISRKDDVLPPKMFVPAQKGSRAGKIPIPFESTLDKYYSLRGWNVDGVPTMKTRRRVGLE